MTAGISAEEFFSPQNGVLTRMDLTTRNRLLGDLVSLLLASDLHRRYRINDIGSVFLPPIHLNQFRIYRLDKRPVGFVTWAWLTPETERKYVTGGYNLHPQDWNAGDQGWIIDFVAPFGHGRQIANDLRSNQFRDKVGKAIRIDRAGKVRGILKLHGADRTADAGQQAHDLELPKRAG